MSILVSILVKNFLQVSKFLKQSSVPISTAKQLNKQQIDRSKVPVLKESDLREEFIHGSGPGGQNVNKLSNCVQLTHLPTGLTANHNWLSLIMQLSIGIVVKCHQNRLQQRNRVIAREILQSKLDDLINGEESVSAQRRRMIAERHQKREKKRLKIRELKTQFKEANRTNITEEHSKWS